MPNKLKIKTDGIVSGSDIPDNAEELEIDCKIIGEKAFANRENLRSVTLINTEVIDEKAFIDCHSLQEINLPDTLLEIKNEAFRRTKIMDLVIPPSVTSLGCYIFSSDRWFDEMPVLEVYQKKDGTFPFTPGCSHTELYTILIVRSEETGEILFKFVVFETPSEVLTEHGVDFKEYDKRFHDIFFYKHLIYVEAARIRMLYPIGLNKEAFEYLKDYVSEQTTRQIKHQIDHFYKSHELTININEFPHFDEINSKHFMELIDYSAQKGATEITALLMQKLHERGGSGGAEDLDL